MKIAVIAAVAALLLCSGAFAKAKHPSQKAKPEPKEHTPASKVVDGSTTEEDSPTGLISSELGGQEMQFLQAAFELGSLETWLGGQAKTRGESDRVKALGDALQSTQAEENQLMVRLARKKGLNLKSGKTAVAEQKQLETKLRPLKGAKFDEAVLEQIVTTTQKEADAYAKAVDFPDPEVKRFAE